MFISVNYSAFSHQITPEALPSQQYKHTGNGLDHFLSVNIASSSTDLLCTVEKVLSHFALLLCTVKLSLC